MILLCWVWGHVKQFWLISTWKHSCWYLEGSKVVTYDYHFEILVCLVSMACLFEIVYGIVKFIKQWYIFWKNETILYIYVKMCHVIGNDYNMNTLHIFIFYSLCSFFIYYMSNLFFSCFRLRHQWMYLLDHLATLKVWRAWHTFLVSRLHKLKGTY